MRTRYLNRRRVWAWRASGGGSSRRLCSSECGSLAWRAKSRRASPTLIASIALRRSIPHQNPALGRTFTAIARWHMHALPCYKTNSRNAISILKNLRREVDNAHSYYFGLRVDADLAMAHFRAGERADALAALRKVLDKGLHEGIYQTILDQGPEIGTLLLSVRENAERSGNSSDFVSYLDHLMGSYPLISPQTKPGPTSPIAEPLSIRESEILTLIAQGRSNKEIARTLSTHLRLLKRT